MNLIKSYWLRGVYSRFIKYMKSWTADISVPEGLRLSLQVNGRNQKRMSQPKEDEFLW